MHVGFFETCLTYLNILPRGAVLIARLYGGKLSGIYRTLVLYLAADTLEGVLTLVFEGNNRELYLYLCGRPDREGYPRHLRGDGAIPAWLWLSNRRWRVGASERSDASFVWQPLSRLFMWR